MRRRRLLQLGATLSAGGLLHGCSATAVSSRVTQSANATSVGSSARVVRRGDPDYDVWHSGSAWQLYKHPRYADAIARPQTADEVARMVALARDEGLRVAVKSGGHNVSGAFYRDGGLLLDLGAFRGMQVDAESQTAWVEPALWSRNMALELERHGLAFPYAHCGTVSMGGYVLGGGIGLNGDAWGGIACANVIEADVLLANADVVRVNERSHPDLYWAVRGGGYGFPGAVLRYRLQLYPLPTHIRTSTFVLPLERAPEGMQWLQDVRDTQPADTELMMLLAHTPQGPATLVRFVVFAHSETAARDRLDAYAQHQVSSKAVARMEHHPLTFEQSFRESVDATRGLGFGHYAAETAWTREPVASVAALLDTFRKAPSPMSHVLVSPRINTNLPSNAAFSHIEPGWLGVYTMWRDGRDNAANFAWHADMTGHLATHATGRYVNETDGFGHPERIRSCYSAGAWERLARIRRRYDPQSLFFGFPT